MRRPTSNSWRVPASRSMASISCASASSLRREIVTNTTDRAAAGAMSGPMLSAYASATAPSKRRRTAPVTMSGRRTTASVWRARMDERVVISREPFNAEARLELQDGALTPIGRHYVRSHFPFPNPPGGIAIAGAVARARTVSLAELRSLEARTLTVTLECAGNGRSFLQPPAPGEQWGLGAVSTARWTGVALRSLLEPAGLSPSVVEILFRGADTGTPPGAEGPLAFERSLPIERALADDVLVAYAMNGTDLPPE